MAGPALDIPTLLALRSEAEKERKKHERLFSKYDNHEDMHLMHEWQHVVEWLTVKAAKSGHFV